VTTVGRRAVDGSFADFLAALAEPEFDGSRAEPSVGWTTRDGRVLHLAWSQAFTVNGRPAGLGPGGRLEETPHLSNPACHQQFGAPRLEVEWKGEQLVIDYEAGRRLHPESTVTPSLDAPGGSHHGR
jgi:hypothetical protein